MPPYKNHVLLVFAFTFFALAQLHLIVVVGKAMEPRFGYALMFLLVVAAGVVFLVGAIRAALRQLLGKAGSARADAAVVVVGAAGFVLMLAWAGLLAERV